MGGAQVCVGKQVSKAGQICPHVLHILSCVLCRRTVWSSPTQCHSEEHGATQYFIREGRSAVPQQCLQRRLEAIWQFLSDCYIHYFPRILRQGHLYRPSATQRSMSPSKGVLFYGPPVLVRPCLPRPSRTSAMRTLRWVVSISHMFTSRCWLSAGSWAPHDVVQWIRSKCPRSFRLSPCCRSLRHVSWFTWWHHVLLGMMHLLYILGCLLLLGGFILHLTFDQLVARSEPRCELWNGAISDRSYPISYVIIIWSYTTTGDVFCIFFLRTKGDS